jgi:MOSC domain-containing protein YiiM
MILMSQTSLKNRTGTIHAVSVSDRKGVVKHNVPSARLLVEHGIEGDVHAEGGIRQLSLLSLASINKMVALGAKVKPGDFAENLTVDGLEVMTLPVGTRLRVGNDVLLEITQIGKTCHKGCAIRELVGDCVMPREGVFARILQEGVVQVGDAVEVLDVPGRDSDRQ